MKGLEYDTSKTGYNAVLKDWQLKAMQVVWSSPDGANSRTVHQKKAKRHGNVVGEIGDPILITPDSEDLVFK